MENNRLYHRCAGDVFQAGKQKNEEDGWLSWILVQMFYFPSLVQSGEWLFASPKASFFPNKDVQKFFFKKNQYNKKFKSHL